MVERGGLENRCSAIAEPGVRIPLSPPKHLQRETLQSTILYTIQSTKSFGSKKLHVMQFAIIAIHFQ